MSQQQNDPVIDEIREVRRQISARVDHDPARLVEYCMKLQEQYQDRLVGASKTSKPAERSAA